MAEYSISINMDPNTNDRQESDPNNVKKMKKNDYENHISKPLHCHREFRNPASIAQKTAVKQLIIASVLCFFFIIVEVIGGILASSLAIATDASHLFSDLASFAISLLALYLASWPATKKMSFGWYRAEILGAMISIMIIWAMTVVLVYLAIMRVISMNFEINAPIMMITAAIGVVINICMIFVLHDNGGGGADNGNHGHSHFGFFGHSHSPDIYKKKDLTKTPAKKCDSSDTKKKKKRDKLFVTASEGGENPEENSTNNQKGGKTGLEESTRSRDTNENTTYYSPSSVILSSDEDTDNKMASSNSNNHQQDSLKLSDSRKVDKKKSGKENALSLKIPELIRPNSPHMIIDVAVKKAETDKLKIYKNKDKKNDKDRKEDYSEVSDVEAEENPLHINKNNKKHEEFNHNNNKIDETTKLLIESSSHFSDSDSSDSSHDKKRKKANASTRNINVRAAFLHVIGDFVQSLGVLLASFIIYFKPDWKIVDPICTFIFSILVLFTTIQILRDIFQILMEGTPNNISFNAIRNALLNIDGVREIHNIRIWSLTTARNAMSAHLALDRDVNSQQVLKKADHILKQQFSIGDVTLQVERYTEEMDDCKDCKPPLT